MNKNRPFIFLCTAMSLDGKISSHKRIDTRISSDDDREFLLDHRVPCDAVMMGGTTVIKDDPGLTVKSAKRQKERLRQGRTKEPIKIGIVSDISKINIKGDFINKSGAPVIIFTSERSSKIDVNKLKKVSDVYTIEKKKVDLKKVIEILNKIGIKSIMVEGGGELIYSLFKIDAVDEINLKIGDLIIGGRDAPSLCDGEGFLGAKAKKVKLLNVKKKNNDLILKYKVINNSNSE